MVKTYILAPDYSTAPPPDGPVKLGSLLTDLTELVPLYPEHHVAIPETALLPVDIKRGFKATRSSLLSGNLGIFARFCGIFGVGVNVKAGWVYEARENDIISFESVETHTFSHSDAYLQQTMAAAPVKAFMEASGGNAIVYMITGLKVGKGAALEASRGCEQGVKLKLGFGYTGTPAQEGPDAGFKRRVEEGISFKASSDFIIAFRVRRISYNKGSAHDVAYNNGAAMLDGTEGGEDVAPRAFASDGDAMIDDMKLFSETGFSVVEGGEVDDGEASLWIVPKIATG